MHPVFHRHDVHSRAHQPLGDLSEEEIAALATPEHLTDHDGLRHLDMTLVKVDPQTRDSQDAARNTQTQVWFEHGPHVSPTFVARDERFGHTADGTPTHDVRLDCGGDTNEEAICASTRLVHEVFGDDSSRV